MTSPRKTAQDHIEKDPVKNKVADAILELSRNRNLQEIPDALIEVAGRRALANRCFFTISDDSNDGINIYAGFKANLGTEHIDREGLISTILPDDCGSCCEYTWEFSPALTVEEAAKKLQAAGFQFDEKEQNIAEKTFTARIKKALEPAAAPKAAFRKAAKEKKPATPRKSKSGGAPKLS